MELHVAPPVDPAVEDVLPSALRRAGVMPVGGAPRQNPWRLAALREAVDPDDSDADYASWPRKTRGATRA